MSEGLVQYVCERCHTRFVLALSGRKLSPSNEVRAALEAARNTALHRDGSYAQNLTEATRRIGQVIADAEYERFRRSFNFCHNCRQFVCSDCWNDTQRQCLTCAPRKAIRAAGPRAAKGPVAPSLDPDGPQIVRPLAGGLVMAAAGGMAIAGVPDAGSRTRSRWPGHTTVALASLVILLLVANIASSQTAKGPLAVNAADSPSATATVIAFGPTATPRSGVTPSPAPDGTIDPRVSTVDMSTPHPTATPTPRVTAHPTPVPTPPPTPRPTTKPTPKPTPKPTAPPLYATASCSPTSYSVGNALQCSASGSSSGSGITYHWFVNGADAGSGPQPTWTFSSADIGSCSVQLEVRKAGQSSAFYTAFVSVS